MARETIIYIAGHTGLVGSALVRRFAKREGVRTVTATRNQLDLTDRAQVDAFLCRERPDAVLIAAGKVGGILANTRAPAEFLYENLMIEANVIHGAWQAGVKRLLNFGSSCMYPHTCAQPMAPAQLMTGALEPTSAPYAVAKWAGMTLCAAYHRQHGAAFMTVIPCTVYGPGDSFDPDNAHVLSALIRKLHEAQERAEPQVALWGTGAPRREFIYADDVAEACELVLSREVDEAPINIGSGQVQSIRDLAALVKDVVGFRGAVHWDRSRPDGAPEKILDAGRLRAYGWTARTPLRVGVEQTYQWWLAHRAAACREDAACMSS